MSLSAHLRDAAIERSRRFGDVIDSCVLDSDGVLDLRAIDDSEVKQPSTRPAIALNSTIGGYDDDIDVTDLYCDTESGHRWFGMRGSD